MMTAPAQQTGPATATLAVVLRGEEGGPELTREAVSDADLLDAHSELWLAGCLRKGRPDMALEELPFRLVPLPGSEGRRCLGFALEADGEAARLEFGPKALSHVASRAAPAARPGPAPPRCRRRGGSGRPPRPRCAPAPAAAAVRPTHTPGARSAR